MFFETYVNMLRDLPQDGDLLYGEPLRVDESLWLAVDTDEYPSLLFRSQHSDLRSDIELNSISVKFSRNCFIKTLDRQNTSGVFTIVRLNENDPDIVRLLLKLLEETFSASHVSFTNKSIAEKILEIANLFRHIANSENDILGLWGELYILSQAPATSDAVSYWCRQKLAKYDFVTKEFALEAKTTLGGRRKHSFSLEQLRPIENFDVYIASLSIVELGYGQTVAELMEQVNAKLDEEDLRILFLNQCILKGGKDIYRSTKKFGVFPDGTSLSIYDAHTLPVPLIKDSDPITNVRFELDLTDMAKLEPARVNSLLLFAER